MENAVRLEDALLSVNEMLITSAHWTFSKPYREQTQNSVKALQMPTVIKSRKL